MEVWQKIKEFADERMYSIETHLNYCKGILVCKISIGGIELAKLDTNGNDYPLGLVQKAYLSIVDNLESFPLNKPVDPNRRQSKFARTIIKNRLKRANEQSATSNDNNAAEGCDLDSDEKKVEIVTRENIDALHTNETRHKRVSKDEDKDGDDKPFKPSCQGTKISDENIGFRMMEKCGWNGGPLGAKSDGIEEPVGVVKKSNRLGLGANRKSAFGYNSLFKYINEYAKDVERHELVFGSDFSESEKKLVKPIAKRLRLKYTEIFAENDQTVITLYKQL